MVSRLNVAGRDRACLGPASTFPIDGLEILRSCGVLIVHLDGVIVLEFHVRSALTVNHAHILAGVLSIRVHLEIIHQSDTLAVLAVVHVELHQQ